MFLIRDFLWDFGPSGCFVEYCPLRKMSQCSFPPYKFSAAFWEIPEYKAPWTSRFFKCKMTSEWWYNTCGSRKKIYSPQPTKSPSIWLKPGPVSQHYHCVYLRLQSRRGTRFIYRIHQRYPVGFGAGIVTGVCCSSHGNLSLDSTWGVWVSDQKRMRAVSVGDGKTQDVSRGKEDI